MPEGDTVWRAARLLDRALSGQVLTATDFRVPALRHRGPGRRDRRRDRLARQAPAHPDRRATQRWTLHTHLKMEGAWRVLEPGQRVAAPGHTGPGRARRPATRSRSASRSASSSSCPRDREDDVVGHLGPDLLGPDWDEDEAVRRPRASSPTAPISEALLDQTQPGRHRQHVRRRALLHRRRRTRAPRSATCPTCPGWSRRAQQMLELNRHRGGPVARPATCARGRRSGSTGRDRRPCRRCGTPIVETMLGDAGRERATYWCPTCQR